ncbi:NADP-dependent oxidoreductase domain-containing protein [Coniochaeta sp. 2T2.1]|nr:NADP-dependent oxidoreductase domain-containing protein [Coniochaeta sp. 2T2.1]
MATSAKSLPHTGLGLLGFTWRPNKPSDEQAIAAMKAAVDNGATVWSSSSVYGRPPYPPTDGLLLLRRYFQKYPEDASKVTLFIRACFDAAKFVPTCTPDGVRASWEECNQILGGVKTIDVFGPARMDQNVPVEETIGALRELQDEGKIGGVGLSEVRAETIRRVAAVCPIKYAEIEFSLWSTEMLDNGVVEAAKENNVAILTYAPLGYGFLTGRVRKLEDIPEGDGRLRMGRFQPDTFYKNLELADKVKALAEKKGVTSAQLALAWIRAHSNKGKCGTIIPIPGATDTERVTQNSKAVPISDQDLAELNAILDSTKVVGHRQIPGMDQYLWT